MLQKDLRFGSILRETYDLFKKNALLFLSFGLLGSFALFLNIYFSHLLDSSYLSPLTNSLKLNNDQIAIIMQSILIIVSLLIGFIVMCLQLTLVQAGHKTEIGKTNFTDSIISIYKKIPSMWNLLLKVMTYTWLWIPIILALGVGLYSSNPMHISYPFAIIILLRALIIIITLLRLSPILRSSFAFTILVTHEEITPEQALKKSIQITQDHLANIFFIFIIWFLFIETVEFFFFMIILISGILIIGFANPILALTDTKVEFAVLLINIIISALFFSLGGLLNYIFMKRLATK